MTNQMYRERFHLDTLTLIKSNIPYLIVEEEHYKVEYYECISDEQKESVSEFINSLNFEFNLEFLSDPYKNLVLSHKEELNLFPIKSNSSYFNNQHGISFWTSYGDFISDEAMFEWVREYYPGEFASLQVGWIFSDEVNKSSIRERVTQLLKNYVFDRNEEVKSKLKPLDQETKRLVNDIIQKVCKVCDPTNI